MLAGVDGNDVGSVRSPDARRCSTGWSKRSSICSRTASDPADRQHWWWTTCIGPTPARSSPCATSDGGCGRCRCSSSAPTGRSRCPPLLDRTVSLLRADEATALSLGPLDATAVADLAERVLGVRPGESLLEALAGAAGIPLFVVELARAASKEGALEIIAGRAELRSPDLPPTFRALVRRRVQALSAEAVELFALLPSSAPRSASPTSASSSTVGPSICSARLLRARTTASSTTTATSWRFVMT